VSQRNKKLKNLLNLKENQKKKLRMKTKLMLKKEKSKYG